MSRFHSFGHPVEVREGMVFRPEDLLPMPDGSSLARIEEEVVVTSTGARLLTRFPADELLVACVRYWSGADFPSQTPWSKPASPGPCSVRRSLPVPEGQARPGAARDARRRRVAYR